MVEVFEPIELPAPEDEPIEPEPPMLEPEPPEPEVPDGVLPPRPEPEDPLEPIPLEELEPEPDPEELASSAFLPQAPSVSKAASATLATTAGLILDVYIRVFSF